jgi:outer membrane murein-binding lipoprotein Lpp
MRSNLEMLHEENAVLLNNISLLRSEKSSLEIDIHTLTQTVKSLEQQHPFGIDNSAADDDEIKGLREKATLLELKLADKEHEIVSLKKEMQNLNSLQGTAKDDNVSTQVEEKSAEIRSLNDEIDATEEEKDYDDDESLQDLLADEEVESDDYLRNQIVILAYALEKSELQRADALDRVIKERKSNAESIRQLGESVKRFYSTVRCSDAV